MYKLLCFVVSWYFKWYCLWKRHEEVLWQLTDLEISKICQENIVSGRLFVKSELKQSFRGSILMDGFNKALLTKKLFSTFSDLKLFKLYSSWWIAMDSLLVLVQVVSVSGLHYNWQNLFSWNFIAIQLRIQNSVKHLR